MTVGYVFSGGGSLGAVQVGMLRALLERGIAPDLLIGTSAGALNAAYLACNGAGADAVGALETIWTTLRRRDVFPLQPIHHVRALVGERPSLFSDRGLRDLIGRHLGLSNFQDARVPVHVVATDLLSGEEVLLSDGDLVSAVLASSALPGLLPPVRRNGSTLVDGGLANNTAISQAVALGADEIYVLPTGYACALPHPPDTATATAVHALTFLTQQRLVREVGCYRGKAALKILPPLCPLGISSVDFRHAAVLIERARVATGRWLAHGGPERPNPERYLSLHQHGPSNLPAANPHGVHP